MLDAGIVAGAGGGIEKTLVAGARLHERAGFHSVLALVHPPSDLDSKRCVRAPRLWASSYTTARRRFRSAL